MTAAERLAGRRWWPCCSAAAWAMSPFVVTRYLARIELVTRAGPRLRRRSSRPSAAAAGDRGDRRRSADYQWPLQLGDAVARLLPELPGAHGDPVDYAADVTWRIRVPAERRRSLAAALIDLGHRGDRGGDLVVRNHRSSPNAPAATSPPMAARLCRRRRALVRARCRARRSCAWSTTSANGHPAGSGRPRPSKRPGPDHSHARRQPRAACGSTTIVAHRKSSSRRQSGAAAVGGARNLRRCAQHDAGALRSHRPPSHYHGGSSRHLRLRWTAAGAPLMYEQASWSGRPVFELLGGDSLGSAAPRLRREAALSRLRHDLPEPECVGRIHGDPRRHRASRQIARSPRIR